MESLENSVNHLICGKCGKYYDALSFPPHYSFCENQERIGFKFAPSFFVIKKKE